ncbi:DUF3341 domain-containing protein [Horticoccus luteus]|uniref:DUF3341 domain-containing protein n=1 Tax=Horticoccus luteus TaxID=2862869 RepID=A0A8F9XJL9_9BACT|nr:DUF3341 domain-containing protein [Horticoccus luteus]QYM78803.1 DUF3341 domain-containing protein [Horticoccus luteus]
MSAALHGVAACFTTPDEFLAALEGVRTAGYDRVEANVPFAVEGMDELLPGPRTPMARIVLIAGLIGGGGAYFMQWFAARDYAYDVGSRPLHSWPAFVPVTFELTILTATIIGVLGLLWLAGLPRLDHPMFAAPGFERASQDRYFLCVRADDPQFNAADLAALFHTFKAELVAEVPA